MRTKAEIVERIKPFVDNIVEEAMRIEKQAETLIQDHMKQVDNVLQEKTLLKGEREEQHKRTEGILEKLNAEKIEQNRLNNEIQNEIAKYHKMNKELEMKMDLATAKENSAETERALTTEALIKAKQKADEYNNKIELLHKDFTDNVAEKGRIAQEWKQIGQLKTANEKERARLAEWSKDVSIADLESKARLKEAKKLEEKFNLEKHLAKH